MRALTIDEVGFVSGGDALTDSARTYDYRGATVGEVRAFCQPLEVHVTVGIQGMMDGFADDDPYDEIALGAAAVGTTMAGVAVRIAPVAPPLLTAALLVGAAASGVLYLGASYVNANQ